MSFFRKSIQVVDLKYDILEKKAYALVKALKSYRAYVLEYNITTYVPRSSVKEFFVQLDSEGKRGKWIVKLQEYDLHINPTLLIKGQGISKLLSQSNCKVLELHQTFTQLDAPMTQSGQDNIQEFEIYFSLPWYIDVIYFLKHLECPPYLKNMRVRSLKLKSIKFFILNQKLYWRDLADILLKFLDEDESKQVTTYMHRGDCGGNHHWKAIALNIIRAG